MKKVLFFLIFLALLGGAVFFLGWAQLTVPPGSYGVMRSKTHGLESQVIQDGEFRWIWYKAIPTNATVSVFTLDPVRHNMRSSGSLPSGQVYTALAGLDADFSWEISGELSFSLRPEFLPELTVRENISDNEGLREAEKRLAARIENLALQRLRVLADNEEKMEALMFNDSLPELSSEIQAFFPEIKDLRFTIRVLRFPDYALYRSLKALYTEYLAHQNAILSQDLISGAERRIGLRLRLDELAQYGDLLTRYPILLQYLTLEKGFSPMVEQ